MDFNYIDAFVLVVLIYSAYKGFSRGFIIVIASLAALVLGIIGAIYFSDITASFLHEKTDISEEYISISAFALTFGGIIAGVHLLAQIINQAVKVVALGPLNKVMGAAFSMLKTVLVLSVVFYLFDFVNTQAKIVNKHTLNDSIAYRPIMGITDNLIPLIGKSDWYNPDKWEETIDDIKDTVEEEIIQRVMDEE